MTIVSPARTARIVEEVADKHGLDVTTMLCTRWRRDMVLARSEAAHRLRTELRLSYAMIAGKLGVTPTGAHKLFKTYKKREAQARMFASTPDPDGRIRELEAELARLTGRTLAEKLADKLRLRLRWAIVLAIVTEAYPRAVRGPALLQLYNDACAQLEYGFAKDGANYQLMTKNVSQLNAHFTAQGWPAPAQSAGYGARRLTDEAAAWLSERVGAPRLSVVLAEREHERTHERQGSPPVRAAMAL